MSFRPGSGPGVEGGDMNCSGRARSRVTRLCARLAVISGALTLVPAVLPPSAYAVAFGNFDSGTDPDLAVADSGNGTVSILLGGAGATFGSPTSYNVASNG